MVSVCAAQERGATPAAHKAASSQSAQARWDAMRAYAAALMPAQRVGIVNGMFNAFDFGTDQDLLGVEDHWDTPLEFVARGAGDCEDFAIAKYFMLLQSGVDSRRLKLAYVFHSGGAGMPVNFGAAGPKRGHMVVLYWGEGDLSDPLVLDLVARIEPLSARSDLQLVFDFDHSATYAIHDSAVADIAVHRMLTHWLGVLSRGGFVGDGELPRLVARNATARTTVAMAATRIKVAQR
jgi:Bacterial transglutaminase-like cysteine proteinase BTLCP